MRITNIYILNLKSISSKVVNFAFSVKCQRCRGQAAALKGSARKHKNIFNNSCQIMLPGNVAFGYVWVYKVPELCFRH